MDRDFSSISPAVSNPAWAWYYEVHYHGFVNIAQHRTFFPCARSIARLERYLLRDPLRNLEIICKGGLDPKKKNGQVLKIKVTPR